MITYHSMLENDSYYSQLKCVYLQSLEMWAVGKKAVGVYSMLWQKEVSVGVAQEISLEDSEKRCLTRR